MKRHTEGIIWIGASMLALIGTIDFFIDDLHLVIPSALIGFSVGYVLSNDKKYDKKLDGVKNEKRTYCC